MSNSDEGIDRMADAEKAMAAIEVVVRTLGPLVSEERRKVIQAALVVLGDVEAPRSAAVQSENNFSEGEAANLADRARLWMKQNGIGVDQLERVFDISDGVAMVMGAQVSGKNNSEKALKAYLLAGIGKFLTSGEPLFDDKEGRALCEHLGCYDSTNHSKYMKEMGNNFVGSKDKGWKLTAPGLKVAASLVKELAES